ncbi:hypothetical protein BR93DRAFT_217649 [Coniochaeta sp. PMI_546]|nr:hypothetical protein BR93DRAFT_217649 [Coniochaeta sp. PMI_546]
MQHQRSGKSRRPGRKQFRGARVKLGQRWDKVPSQLWKFDPGPRRVEAANATLGFLGIVEEVTQEALRRLPERSGLRCAEYRDRWSAGTSERKPEARSQTVRQSGLGEHQRRTCGGGNGGVGATEEQDLSVVAISGGEGQCRTIGRAGSVVDFCFSCVSLRDASAVR